MVAGALAALAVALPCGPPEAKTVTVQDGVRIYKRADLPGKPYFGCVPGQPPRRVWRSAAKPGEVISFDLARVSNGRVAFVDYYCTLAGYHVAHVRRVDLRTGARRSWQAHSTDPVDHVKPRVLNLSLAADGRVSWAAEHLGAAEQLSYP